MRRAAPILAAAILAAAILAAPAAAQESSPPYDGIEADVFSTSETQAANQDIQEADQRYAEIEDEVAQVEEDVGPLSGADQITELEDEQDQLEDEVASGVNTLITARTEAIQEADAPLEEKQNALDEVATYASNRGDVEDETADQLAGAQEAIESEIAAAGSSGDQGGGDAGGGDAGGAAPSGGDSTESSGGGLPIWLNPFFYLALLVIVPIVVAVLLFTIPGAMPLLATLGIQRFRASRKQKKAMSTQGIHTADPHGPAATVREVTPQIAANTIGSTAGTWHLLGADYISEHGIIYAGTGSGKNQTVFNEAAYNVIAHRPESAVILDAKADMLNDMAEHIEHPQFVFSAIPPSENDRRRGKVVHSASSAINLVSDPQMAAATAAALYPVKGTEKPIFNQASRELFEAIAEALGHENTSIFEVYQVLQDEALMAAIGERNPRVKQAIPQGKDFRGSVIGSATAPLNALNNWDIARMFCPEPGQAQPDFRSKQTAWVCVPPDPDIIESFGPLAGALIAALNRIAREAREPGVRFLIDEAASFLTISQLASYLSVGRGMGVTWLMVIQDISQFQHRLGKEQAEEILGNIKLHVLGAGSSETNANWISSRTGHITTRERIYEQEDTIFRKWAEFKDEAEWRMDQRERQAVKPEHLLELEQGSWFVWQPGPRSASGVAGEIVHGAYWYAYMQAVLGGRVRPRILGLGPEVGIGERRHPAREAAAPPPEPPRETPPEPPKETPRETPSEPPDANQPRREDEPRTSTDTGHESPEDGPQEPQDTGEDMYPPEMSECGSCGQVAPPEARFCPGCGGRLT